jgi:hypothetical protein
VWDGWSKRTATYIDVKRTTGSNEGAAQACCPREPERRGNSHARTLPADTPREHGVNQRWEEREGQDEVGQEGLPELAGKQVVKKVFEVPEGPMALLVYIGYGAA